MKAALKAGVVYFAIVFATGFVLGTIRVLALARRLDETLAVGIELPIMLAISWLTCNWLVAYFQVPAGSAHRLVMGGSAFCILMLAEAGLSIFAFGRAPVEHLENYKHSAAIIGLLGQFAFALFPAIQLKFGSRTG